LFCIEKRLHDISMAPDYRAVVTELIEDAERAGYTMRLLNAARQSQPGNEALQVFARQFKLSAATFEQERIVRETKKFLPIAQWRAPPGGGEGRGRGGETGSAVCTAVVPWPRPV